jgi:hypothetical protein
MSLRQKARMNPVGMGFGNLPSQEERAKCKSPGEAVEKALEMNFEIFLVVILPFLI